MSNNDFTLVIHHNIGEANHVAMSQDGLVGANQILSVIMEELFDVTTYALTLEQYDCMHGDIENIMFENHEVHVCEHPFVQEYIEDYAICIGTNEDILTDDFNEACRDI